MFPGLKNLMSTENKNILIFLSSKTIELFTFEKKKKNLHTLMCYFPTSFYLKHFLTMEIFTRV